MTFLKRVKSKKVIVAVLSIIVSINMFLTSSHAMETKTKMKNVSHTRIETQTTMTQSRQVKYSLKVGATAYCGDTITSTGKRPVEGTTIAVDPKVIPYGTKVYIPEFNRVFTAEDCGSAIKGNRIDIFMNDYDRCMEWGYQNITIYILK
jgi:3D (Asp-Asp-Asp) domain-containing protein